MREKSCFFTGHRRIYGIDSLKLHMKATSAVRDMYRCGVRRFISGGAVGFDMVAAEAVLSLKESGADVSLSLYLPCEGHTSGWSERDAVRFCDILKAADEVRYTKKEYDGECMRLRNQSMVLNAAYCITWYENRPGGTNQTLAMARKMNCTVRNLAKEKW